MRDNKGRFTPGNCANPTGRPMGSKHKLRESFLQKLAADFEVNGSTAIEKCRTDNPSAYLRVIAALVPKDFVISENPYDAMSHEEVESELEKMAMKLADQFGYIKAVNS